MDVKRRNWYTMNVKPNKKIYVYIFIIVVYAFLWYNQGLSKEILKESFKDTIKTLKINNIVIGDDYSPILTSPLENRIVYKKIGINITLYNPSDYCLEITLDSFSVTWMTSFDYSTILGGIQNEKTIIIKSKENLTLVLEGLSEKEKCQYYLRNKGENPEFGFNTQIHATTDVSNGKIITYYLSHNFDGSVSTEEYG